VSKRHNKRIKRAEPLLGKAIPGSHLRIINRLGAPKHDPNRPLSVLCQCSCGRRLIIRRANLTRAEPKKHCGARHGWVEKDVRPLDRLIRPISANPEYHIYRVMLQRCYDPKHPSYSVYGGNDIKVAPEWHKQPDDNFSGFLAFVNYMGLQPTPFHSIDRIKNELGYMPGNVRWATPQEQAANKKVPLSCATS
jgi:hypothetical protein